jgi:tetratricopeptide (TPR) repeat protein
VGKLTCPVLRGLEGGNALRLLDGKTQIAVEYVYRHRQDYQTVLWTLADTHASLTSGYVAIAELLNLPEKDEQDQTKIAEAVKRWLSTHTGWLLILDNADDLTQIDAFLPSSFGGHLLLTTRAHATGTRAYRLEVDSMLPDVGALFLLRRAKLINPEAMLPDADEDDVRMAREISETLGGLPLALDQAGAYIEETGCSLSDYLDLFKQRQKKFLERRGTVPADHRQSVTITFALAFEKVQQRNKAAIELLSLCSYLVPDLIPLELIVQGAPYLGTVLEEVSVDPFQLNQALKVLQTYSLVQRNSKNNTLSMHRLVQAVLKDGMDRETQSNWMQRVIQALNAVFPEVEFKEWTKCGRLLPHVLLCSVTWIEDEPMPTLEAAPLLRKAGVYLQERGQYKDAEPLLVRALSIREQQSGETHLDTAMGLNNLANLYWYQGKYEQAEPLHQRALSIREQQLGETHPDTAKSLDNLANLYMDQGKYKLAEPLYQRALSIHEQQLGETDPDTARNLHNLAVLYTWQGKYELAEPLYERAHSIQEQQLGETHPNTTLSLNNLATLYMLQGKYELAEPLCQRALSIHEQQLGAVHPETAASLNNLANLYYQQGKYDLAEPLYQRTLSIREQQLGVEHPETAVSLNNLAELYTLQGKYELAEPLYKRALSIKEQLGAKHPATAHPLHGLAELYQRQGKYEQAEPLYLRALSIREQVLGPTHPYTQETRKAYAAFLCLLGRDEEVTMLDTDHESQAAEGH